MRTFKNGIPTILVVEDSDDTRAIIRLELERWVTGSLKPLTGARRLR
jgi:hypothetical protein